jgi:hypothetical protein
VAATQTAEQQAAVRAVRIMRKVFIKWRLWARGERLERPRRLQATRRQLLRDVAEAEALERLARAELQKRVFRAWAEASVVPREKRAMAAASRRRRTLALVLRAWRMATAESRVAR